MFNEKLTTADIVKFVITVISAIDFTIFIIFFVTFVGVVTLKGEKKSTKIISCIIIFGFICYKLIHIPMFLSTISVFKYKIQGSEIQLGILTYTNLTLAAIPLWLAVYTTCVQKKIKKEDVSSYDKTITKIIMPIYNEKPLDLYNAVLSVINLQYTKNMIHLYLAFDDDGESDAYLYLMKKFGLIDDNGVYLVNKSYKHTIDVYGVLISICSFKHGGKKSAQFGAFKEVENDYKNIQNEDPNIFFIDSDIVLKSDSLVHFNYHMQIHGKNCLTGMISCIASDNPNFLTFYQDIEYISGQVFWRNFENTLGGASTCLPGAFTIMKYSSLKKVSHVYFNKSDFDDAFDYYRYYLGEDRYLTQLLMESEPWKIGFCETARCKTVAPKDFNILLKQRRRWALGHISNDTWMMSSLRLWKTYPLLSIFNFLNNSRNSSMYVYLLYFVLILNKQINIWMWFVFIILPILLNWIFIMVYALKIRRKTNIIFYIVILLVQPVLSMVYFYYTLYTIRSRGWGGPRSNKSKKQELDSVVIKN